MIDADEYEGWRAHPVTQAVFAELRARAEHRKELWVAQSWGAGDVDERKMLMLKGQAEAFAFLPDATHAEVFGETEEK